MDALTITHWEKAVPLGAIAVSRLTGIEVAVRPDPKYTSDSPPLLSLPEREELSGNVPILRYLVRSSKSLTLYGQSVLASVQVDQWLDFSSQLVSGVGLEAACSSINDYLSLRTFLAGYNLTVADIACWAQLFVTLQWDKLSKSGKFPHVVRWYSFVSAIPELKAVGEEFAPRRRRTAAETKVEAAASGKGGGDTGSFDIGLPNAVVGQVVTRFPPEPSGFLHIGHAKALLLNQHFAQMYKGRMRVRFDDTNPSKEKEIFVESILQDIDTLGASPGTVTYTSDYFPQMLDLAERLIKAGHVYADDTPMEQMRAERMDGIPSKRRDRPVAESLAVWEEMKKGSKEGVQNCLRFKMDMAALNKALRDPVAYRCNDIPHVRIGQKYKVYPTYDCACPFVDALEGVTHALRTSEYKDREAQFYWILKMEQEVWPGLPHVQMWDFSRLSFVNTVLSKRKLTWFVDNGVVDGWNDPRMPTVQGILRRGMQVKALREFILSQGASKNVTLQEWDKIWTLNKRIIDPVCPRHTAVQAAGRVLLRLRDVSQAEYVTVDRHKKHPPAGKKAVLRTGEVWIDQEDAQQVAKGEEVTLMDWGNAIIQEVVRDAAGQVTSLEGVTHLEGSVKNTKLRWTWLGETPELVPLTLVEFDHIITKKKIEPDDDIEKLVNRNSLMETAALGDANMRTLQRGDVIQLERKGYFIVDEPLLRPGKPLVLFGIPDGRTKALARSAALPATNGPAVRKHSSGRSEGSKGSAPAASSCGAHAKIGGEGQGRQKSPLSVASSAAGTSASGQASLAGGLAPVMPMQEAVTIASQQSQQAFGAQPIPVPARKGSVPGSRGSVPPTPANTPQASSIPPPSSSGRQATEALRSMEGTARQGVAIPAEKAYSRGSVPPTPNNTPQTSRELPAGVGLRSRGGSPLAPSSPVVHNS